MSLQGVSIYDGHDRAHGSRAFFQGVRSMPFLLVPESESDPIDLSGFTAYPDRRAAFAARVSEDLRLIYVPTVLESQEWRARELDRFADGTYTRAPWANVDAYPDHFCHLAIDAVGKVAYTADEESGYSNRKVSTNPGRYLERFYAHVSPETRAVWIASCKPQTLQIATTADEIETVYRNAVGFHSCMGPDHHKSFRIHPTRVYGDSDLALAYLGPINRATARAVIWPAKKIHSRIYGLREELRLALESNGYTDGDLDGARIKAIDHPRGGYVMPYVDGSDNADDQGDGWLVLGSGDIDTKTQTGRSDEMSECAQCGGRCESDHTYCDSCEDDRFTCEHCGDESFDRSSAPYCDSCNEDRNVCDHCHEDTWDETHEVINARNGWQITICDHCARNADRFAFSCIHCASSETEADYTLRSQKERQKSGTALTLCESCVSDGVAICPDCDKTREDVTEPCADCCPGTAIAADLTAVCEAS